MSNAVCNKIGAVLESYYDGQLSPEERRRCEKHLRRCRRCSLALEEYASISRVLTGLARHELGQGESISLWPVIRQRLAAEQPVRPRRPRKRRLLFLPRPAWIGISLSAAAALFLFFSGVLTPPRLPENYCRIESVNAPEHNLLIYRDQSDGLTIIWLME